MGELNKPKRSQRGLTRRGAAPGKESNWLETIPGKSWFPGLRMYGPLEPWINKTWCPSEIELVK